MAEITNKMIKAGIVGGAGYTGGELARILLNHENVVLVAVQSRSQAGKPIHSVHRDLFGTTELCFQDSMDGVLPQLDVIFLALPHGEAKRFLESTRLPEKLKVIDLSQDFRLKPSVSLASIGASFVYGLPELNREAIRGARFIANPGCFATAIQLALLPLAKANLLAAVSVVGITGSTGAGQGLSETSHFSFRANNIQAYKTLEHQHCAEIEQSLQSLQKSQPFALSFVPWRGDFTRGIFISAMVATRENIETIRGHFQKFYEGMPFVSLSFDQPIDLKAVVNTNRAQIGIEEKNGMLAIHVAIDNLLKGASGQAVQNMNLMFHLDEMAGLKLKGAAF